MIRRLCYLSSALLVVSATSVLALDSTSQASGYQRTKDGRSLVYDEHPKKGKEATWSGAHDPEGYAEGYGTLTWYKGNSAVRRLSGKMVRGKFVGTVTKTGVDGKTSTVAYGDGKPARPTQVTEARTQSSPANSVNSKNQLKDRVVRHATPTDQAEAIKPEATPRPPDNSIEARLKVAESELNRRAADADRQALEKERRVATAPQNSPVSAVPQDSAAAASQPIPTAAANESASASVTTGADGLTTDRSKWRIVRKGSPMYSDEDAYQKIRQNGTDTRNPTVLRMAHEEEFQKARRAIKVELLQEHGPHDMCKIRFFFRREARTVDMWAAESDIIPYNEDLWNKARLEAENDEETNNETLLSDRLKPLDGKTVRIREGSLLLSDDKFWEFAVLVRKRQDALAIKKSAEWVNASEGHGNSVPATLAGENSFGTVTSINAPYFMFLRVESTLEDQRKITFWITTSDVRLDSDPPTSPVLHRFAKLESVKINGASINDVPHSDEIKRVALNGLVKDAVQRAIANVEKTQSPAGIHSLLHPTPTATPNFAKSDNDEATIDAPEPTAPSVPTATSAQTTESKVSHAAEKKNTVQWKSKKDAGFLRDPDMSQDEITFWANAIVVMANSGELVMECDNNRAYINPNTWTAGEGGGVWSAQRRLARAILLACHGVSGSDRVDIYDGETRQKLASYSRAGGYTQY